MKQISHLDSYAPKMVHYLERSAPVERVSTAQRFSSKPTFSDVGFGPTGPRSKRKQEASDAANVLKHILLGVESTKNQRSTKISTAAKSALKTAPTTSRSIKQNIASEVAMQGSKEIESFFQSDSVDA